MLKHYHFQQQFGQVNSVMQCHTFSNELILFDGSSTFNKWRKSLMSFFAYVSDFSFHSIEQRKNIYVSKRKKKNMKKDKLDERARFEFAKMCCASHPLRLFPFFWSVCRITFFGITNTQSPSHIHTYTCTVAHTLHAILWFNGLILEG